MDGQDEGQQWVSDLRSLVAKCSTASVGVFIDNARRQSFIILLKKWYIRVRPSVLIAKLSGSHCCTFTLNDLFLWTWPRAAAAKYSAVGTLILWPAGIHAKKTDSVSAPAFGYPGRIGEFALEAFVCVCLLRAPRDADCASSNGPTIYDYHRKFSTVGIQSYTAGLMIYIFRTAVRKHWTEIYCAIECRAVRIGNMWPRIKWFEFLFRKRISSSVAYRQRQE